MRSGWAMSLLLATALAWMSLNRSCTEPGRIVPDKTDSLMALIQDIKDSIGARGSVIERSSDTVIYRSTQVKNLVVEYRLVRDTVEKLRVCDSLADQAEELAYEAWVNDSLHKKQEADMEVVIAKQDTVIDLQKDRVFDADKRMRWWRRGAIGSAAVAVIVSVIK